ncbi:LCP family protein [Kitasatospora sp. NPDC001175]|uniref:LCP family protein n=1 Tax=Kitasatospora sp. NPDC001175 TaxID=3157103 RepID=UPI003D075A2B
MTGTADRRGPEDGWYPQPGYDGYGRPEHGQDPQYSQGQYQYGQQQGYPQEQYQGYQQQPYEPQQYQQQGYYQQPLQEPVHDPYGQPQHPYQPQQQEYYYQQQPAAQPVVQPVVPAQTPAEPAPAAAAPVPPQVRRSAPAQPAARPRPERTEPDDPYVTGEFTFLDEEAEETEDVIDWLKFAESRTEVRAERKRRLRNRLIAAVVALVVLAGGGVGYLWWSGKLGGTKTVAAAAGGRQVNVVQLRDLNGKVTSVLLVNDAGAHKGSILLLPDILKLPSAGDSPTVPIGQAMDTVGASATREGLKTVLGAPVAGTWRLDTPYLQLLVSQLGGVRVDTNADVKGADGKVTPAGKGTTLSGDAAVAYATYQAPGEGRDAQLARFGQVLDAVVRAMPTDLPEAQDDVHRMNAVLDPSLPEQALAGVLAQLAQLAKDGAFSTSTLKVQPDGTLDEATAGAQVKQVLGGTVHKAQSGTGTPRVSIVNASGNDQAATSALVQVSNAGLNVVPSNGKSGSTQATSEIRYTDDARAAAAKSLATTLGLNESAVKKTTDAQNADLVVVLGKDYQPGKNP